MIVSNASAQGSRPYQEDYHAYYTAPAGMSQLGALFLLADGMGGLAGGGTASYMAVEHFKRSYFMGAREGAAEPDIPSLLGKIMPEANAQLLSASKADVNLTGMGTTLIAAALVGDRLYWASVGDSRLYVLRDARLMALNEDHSVGGQLKRKLAAGEITAEQAKGFEGQHHKLVHYLGNRSFTHFDVSREPFALLPDDVVVMCSDGLYGTLSEAEIIEVLQRAKPELYANELVQRVLAKQAPGQDNVTVQVISGCGDWRLSPEAAPHGPRSSAPRKIGLALAMVALAALLGLGAYLYSSNWRSKSDAATAPAAAQGSADTAQSAQPGAGGAPNKAGSPKGGTEPAAKPAPAAGTVRKSADKGADQAPAPAARPSQAVSGPAAAAADAPPKGDETKKGGKADVGQ